MQSWVLGLHDVVVKVDESPGGGENQAVAAVVGVNGHVVEKLVTTFV